MRIVDAVFMQFLQSLVVSVAGEVYSQWRCLMVGNSVFGWREDSRLHFFGSFNQFTQYRCCSVLCPAACRRFPDNAAPVPVFRSKGSGGREDGHRNNDKCRKCERVISN